MRTLVVMVLAGAACAPPGPKARPSGTPSDPVEVCDRVADVCRLDGSRLGVCIAAAPSACDGRAPCFTCMSQH